MNVDFDTVLYIAMERKKVNVYSQNYISLYLVAKLDVLHITFFEGSNIKNHTNTTTTRKDAYLGNNSYL